LRRAEPPEGTIRTARQLSRMIWTGPGRSYAATGGAAGANASRNTHGRVAASYRGNPRIHARGRQPRHRGEAAASPLAASVWAFFSRARSRAASPAR
jgi:hypothetical protein